MLNWRRVAAAPALLLSALSLVVGTPAAAQKKSLCVHGIEAPAGLPMRAGSAPDSHVIEEIPAKTCGLVLSGRCIGKLCQMTVGGKKGWVDTAFVGVYEMPDGTEPPKAAVIAPVPPAAPSIAPQPAAQPSARSGPRLSAPRTVVQRVAFRAPERRNIVSPRARRGACVVDVERWDTLRIRRGPGIDYREIGEIPSRACGVVEVGGCQGSWCRISWRGQHGWVNTRYLDD